MLQSSALKIAVELVHVPSKARLVRAAPLPDDVDLLLRIAAGEPDARQQAVDASGRTADVVVNASEFFIEQILFSAESDSYRVLGARETASNSELRRNMALLVKALHPDLSQNRDRSMFAGRVTKAWDDLKTQERRDAYDAQRKPGGSSAGQGPATRAPPHPLMRDPKGTPNPPVTLLAKRVKLPGAPGIGANGRRPGPAKLGARSGLWAMIVNYFSGPGKGRR